jgi:hypothetical protein
MRFRHPWASLTFSFLSDPMAEGLPPLSTVPLLRAVENGGPQSFMLPSVCAKHSPTALSF